MYEILSIIYGVVPNEEQQELIKDHYEEECEGRELEEVAQREAHQQGVVSVEPRVQKHRFHVDEAGEEVGRQNGNQPHDGLMRGQEADRKNGDPEPPPLDEQNLTVAIENRPEMDSELLRRLVGRG